MSSIKETLERELDQLQQTRDELRVKLHLAKADARDEWERLETKWESVEQELRRLSKQSKQPLNEMADAARNLMGELKAGYTRLRSRMN